MKYELPFKSKVKKHKVVSFRIPKRMQHAFALAVRDSGLNGQQLVQSMSEYCLKETGYL